MTFLGGGGLPTGLVAGGALVAGAGVLDPNPKRGVGLMMIGGGIAVAGLIRGAQVLPDLKIGFGEDAIPLGKVSAGGLWEGAKAAVGLGPEGELPGLPAFDPTEERAEPLGDTGKPKNIYLMAGRFQDPTPGSRVTMAPEAPTFPVVVLVENKDTEAHAGKLTLRVRQSGAESVVPGSSINLEPGEGRRMSFFVQRPRRIPGELAVPMELGLLWRGFLLDRTGFMVLPSLF